MSVLAGRVLQSAGVRRSFSFDLFLTGQFLSDKPYQFSNRITGIADPDQNDATSGKRYLQRRYFLVFETSLSTSRRLKVGFEDEQKLC